MKTHLPFFCTLAALCSSAHAFIVEGVAMDAQGNMTDTSRFYDTGKGFYWNWKGEGGTVYRNAKKIYSQTKSFAFLGDLQGRISNPTAPMSPASFSKMTGDAPMCWAMAAANMLQYWVDEYGGFAERTEGSPLPCGLTYDAKYLVPLGGTQSLQIALLLTDNLGSSGGDFADGIRFYLVENGENNGPDDLHGFYFERYFQGQPSVVDRTTVNSAGEAKAALVRCFGYDAATGTATAKGQIAGLSLVSPGGGGHAITCYGFELDASGRLSMLYVCNPDDEAYRLERVYLPADGSSTMLYTDSACRTEWLYNGKPWSIACVDFINTPQCLRDMRAQSPRPAASGKASPSGKSGKGGQPAQKGKKGKKGKGKKGK